MQACGCEISFALLLLADVLMMVEAADAPSASAQAIAAVGCLVFAFPCSSSPLVGLVARGLVSSHQQVVQGFWHHLCFLKRLQAVRVAVHSGVMGVKTLSGVCRCVNNCISNW